MKFKTSPLIQLFKVTICLCVLYFGSAVRAQTWIELSPSGSPPDPIYSPKHVNYDAANNRLIVFFPGNPPYGGFGNQVWVLTNANGLGGAPVWINLTPSGAPSFSNGEESVVYDAATNRLIVYGGCYANCSPALWHVFTLTNANGLGGPSVWSQSTVTNPQPRVGHSAIYDSLNDLMITFGGQFAFFGTDQNDTRILNNANGLVSPSTWSTLATSGGPPAIRDEHVAVYDETNNRMIVFAGHNLISTCCPYLISDYNDAWVLTNANGIGGTPVWANLAPAGTPPSVRTAPSAVYDSTNNRMLIFGGSQWDQPSQTYSNLGDLWELSSANGLGGTPAWTQLTQSGTLPGPRVYHAAAFDQVNQRMIVLGGRDATDTPSNRVWVLTLADETPPEITNVSTNLSALWPPNHKMVNITVNYDVSDNISDSSSISCTLSVSSNEPQNGLGDGDTDHDWEIIGAHNVKLRAERSGTGNGRVYTITISCADEAGNTTVSTVTVSVKK